MKNIFIMILMCMLLPGVCIAEENSRLDTEKARVSYSVGYQVGVDFKRQGVDIKPEMIIEGVQDALAGKEPVMSREEMRDTLAELQKQIMEIRERRRIERAEQNLRAGMAFLSANGKKEGIMTLPSGLQYLIVTEGTGKKPGADDTVTVHYRGSLIDGTEFDSSYKRGEPAVFKPGQVIAGWKEALPLMKEGSKWQLFIPPSLAYGDRTMGRIEPNSTLVFDIDLISVNNADYNLF